MKSLFAPMALGLMFVFGNLVQSANADYLSYIHYESVKKFDSKNLNQFYGEASRLMKMNRLTNKVVLQSFKVYIRSGDWDEAVKAIANGMNGNSEKHDDSSLLGATYIGSELSENAVSTIDSFSDWTLESLKTTSFQSNDSKYGKFRSDFNSSLQNAIKGKYFKTLYKGEYLSDNGQPAVKYIALVDEKTGEVIFVIIPLLPL